MENSSFLIDSFISIHYSSDLDFQKNCILLLIVNVTFHQPILLRKIVVDFSVVKHWCLERLKYGRRISSCWLPHDKTSPDLWREYTFTVDCDEIPPKCWKNQNIYLGGHKHARITKILKDRFVWVPLGSMLSCSIRFFLVSHIFISLKLIYFEPSCSKLVMLKTGFCFYAQNWFSIFLPWTDQVVLWIFLLNFHMGLKSTVIIYVYAIQSNYGQYVRRLKVKFECDLDNRPIHNIQSFLGIFKLILTKLVKRLGLIETDD